MEDIFMKVKKLVQSMKMPLIIGLMILNSSAAWAVDNLILYTPNTKISVAPGATIDYKIDVINKSEVLKNESLVISNLPRGWRYTLKSGAYIINSIAVLPGEKQTLNLKVEVPFRVNKGDHYFYLKTTSANLPLVVRITEKGTDETELTTKQANMQGNSTSTFLYKATLRNRTAETQNYALMGDTPRGWSLVFKASNKSVTAVEMEPNSTKEIAIELKPSAQVSAGTYKISVRALTGSTSADLELEAVVTGSYDIELTTPTGLLSTNLTAGKEKQFQLMIRNTGSSDLTDVKMKSTLPSKWEMTFKPTKIDTIRPGSSATVDATLKSHKNAIPGDYMANIVAKTPEATSSKISYRVMIKTPMIWGWIGVIIILAALGGVWYLFRKFGRR
jgi:uncharacterized membrane protein